MREVMVIVDEHDVIEYWKRTGMLFSTIHSLSPRHIMSGSAVIKWFLSDRDAGNVRIRRMSRGLWLVVENK